MSDVRKIAPSNVKGDFPHHLVTKPDSERVQNIPNEFLAEHGYAYVATEKLDGTSITVYNEGGEAKVAGRNWEVHSENHEIWKILDKQAFLDHTLDGEAFQGELVGPRIQKNPLKLDQNLFFVHSYFRNREVQPLTTLYTRVDHELGMRVTPFRWDMEIGVEGTTREDLLEKVSGLRSVISDVPAEGVVFHHIHGKTIAPLTRHTFEVINNEYL